MVQVTALESFNMLRVLNFGVIAAKATGFAFLDNFNQSVFGTTFNDVAAYEFTYAGSHLALFGGSNFAFDPDNVPTAGTVTAMALANGALVDGIAGQALSAAITGFSIDAVSLGQAIISPDKLDDAAIILTMFNKDDRFDLSNGNDVAYGFGGNDTMFGNGGDDKLYGGGGNDVLDGGLGKDTLNGGAGSDAADYTHATLPQTIDLSLKGAQTNGDTLISIEKLNGSAFGDTFTASIHGSVLAGLAGDDSLTGGAKADLLIGGRGNDTLTGGGGNDRFIFDVDPANPVNGDVITDFAHLHDKITLDSAIYGMLPTSHGHLAATAFYTTGSTFAAHDATDRIVYNSTTGGLFFDPDGLNGQPAVQIAQLGIGTHPTLSANDIIMI